MTGARRVAVTGLGVVTPYGDDPSGLFDALLRGESAIRLFRPDDAPRPVAVPAARCAGAVAAGLGQHGGEAEEAGRDRDRVGRERCQPCGNEGVAVLEAALEEAGAERVADDERDERCQPDAPEDDELRGDVATGEERPGSQAECRGASETEARHRKHERDAGECEDDELYREHE